MNMEDLKALFRPKPSAKQPKDGELLVHCGHQATFARPRVENRAWYFKDGIVVSYGWRK